MPFPYPVRRRGWRVAGKPIQLSIPMAMDALLRALLVAEQSAYDDPDWPVNTEVRIGFLESDLLGEGSPVGLLMAVQWEGERGERIASLIEGRLIDQNRTAITIWARPGPTADGLYRLAKALVRLVPEAEALHEAVATVTGMRSAASKPSKPYGPTEKIIERAEQIRALKEKNPTWSQEQVARWLDIPVATIRYVYRAMGWTWERADRVRRRGVSVRARARVGEC